MTVKKRAPSEVLFVRQPPHSSREERVAAMEALLILCETSTPRRGRRSNTVDHVTHVAEHGFIVVREGVRTS